MAEVMLITFSHWKTTLPHPSHPVLFGRRSLFIAHSEGAGSYTPLLEGKGPHKLLGIHLHGIFVYSPFLLFLNVSYLSLKCWNNRTTPTCQWLNTRLISCPCHDIYHGSASGLFVLHSLSGTQALAGPPRGELRLLTHPAFPSCQGRRRALEGFAPAIKCFSLDVTQVNSTHSSATPGGRGI